MADRRAAITRRKILKRAGTVGATCVLATLRGERAIAQSKIAKAEVDYQDRPNGQQHCAVCAFYVPPVACRVVRGEVSPNGWCDRFQQRAG